MKDKPFNHNLGSIIFWGIIRLALTIAGVWILYYYLEYRYWWIFGILALYAVVLNPAIIQYKIFKEKNKEIIENTLCSSCKYFVADSILCLRLDEHPSKTYLPCEGEGWEPKSFEDKYEEEFH